MMNNTVNARPSRGLFWISSDSLQPSLTYGQALGNALENYIFDQFSILENCISTFGRQDETTQACDIQTASGVLIEVKSHRDAEGSFRPSKALELRGMSDQLSKMRALSDTLMAVVGVYQAHPCHLACHLETGKQTMQYKAQPEMIQAFRTEYVMWLYMEHKGTGRWVKVPQGDMPIWDWIDVPADLSKSLKDRIIANLERNKDKCTRVPSLQGLSTSNQGVYPTLEFIASPEDDDEQLAAANMFEAISTYMVTLVDNQSAAERSELENTIALVKSVMMADLSKVKDGFDSHNKKLIELGGVQQSTLMSIRSFERELNELGRVQSDDIATLKRRISTLEERVKQSKRDLEQANQNATCLGNNMNSCLESYNELATAFQASTTAHDTALRYLYNELGVDIEEAFSDEG